jgi:hypothetical protein
MQEQLQTQMLGRIVIQGLHDSLKVFQSQMISASKPSHILLHPQDVYDLQRYMYAEQMNLTEMLDVRNGSFKFRGIKLVRSYDVEQGTFTCVTDNNKDNNKDSSKDSNTAETTNL